MDAPNLKRLDAVEVPCGCKRCPICRGTGTEHWYLGDEFNSQGYCECETCDGTGTIADDCAAHSGAICPHCRQAIEGELHICLDSDTSEPLGADRAALEE